MIHMKDLTQYLVQNENIVNVGLIYAYIFVLLIILSLCMYASDIFKRLYQRKRKF